MKRPSILASLFLAAGAVWAATGAATFGPKAPTPGELLETPRDGTRLLLVGAVFDPTIQEPDFSQVGLPGGVDGAHAIVQFKPGRIQAKEALQAAGVQFVGYLPDNAFQVRLNNESRALLEGHEAVRWMGPYKVGYKVHPRLWPGSGERVDEVTVRVFPDASLEGVLRALAARAPEAARLQTSDLASRNLRYSVPQDGLGQFVAEAAQVSGVALIEPYDPTVPANNDSLGPIQSNVPSNIVGTTCTNCSMFNHGLTGTGQIAAVADSGNDSDMCYYRYDANPSSVTDAQSPVPPDTGVIDPTHKMIAYYVQPGAAAYDAGNYHGTATSAILVGDNFSNLSTPTAPGIDVGDGMAPNAKLVFQDVASLAGFTGLGDRYNLYLQALDAGARAHSNSYGDLTGGAYTAADATTDRFLFDHEDMAIFFAAANAGPAPNTTASPGNAKDVVTVGALAHGNDTTIADFSSRGPTDDGRRKPDIMAAGVNNVTAQGDASHTSANCGLKFGFTGTSASSPTVAGGAALLRQYFEDGHYPTGSADPADALSAHGPLVKAALLNGTLPLPAGGVFGGFDYGWGRIFLDENLYFSGDAREVRVWNVLNTDGLQTGGSGAHSVTVAAGQEFRATLVWSDPEASPGAGASLVNNLDLSVNDGTNTYLGNVFDASGVSIPGGVADVVNNVEQVRLTAPTAGTYTIAVGAPSVPGNGRAATNRQGFALVVSHASCATGVSGAPTGLAAADHAPMGVDLTWTSAAGSTVTQAYRAAGDCTTAAREFQYVGSSTGAAFTDVRAQGGLTYAYKVRGADGCGEGPASGCMSITPAGVCDLVPTFGGLSTAIGGFPDGQTCNARLGWSPGSSNCPAGPSVLYDIYRSTTPNFTPAPGNLLATVSGVTTYDDPSVVTNTTYYYVVRAEDGTAAGGGPNGGNQEPNSIEFFATAIGPPGSPGTLSDGAGDGQAFGSPESPWRITSAQAHTGTFSYHPGPDTGWYPPSTCAALTTPGLSLAGGANLSYWVRYRNENFYDGTVVEISTDGGGSWSDLPPTTPAGYPGNLLVGSADACGYGAHGAFTGPPGNGGLTPWTQYQTNLGAFAGQNVMIRWRFTTDPVIEFEGFYLDDIQITNVNLPGPCVPVPVELQTLSVE